MHAKQELSRSIQILERDALDRFEEFTQELHEDLDYELDDFTKRWDNLRRELREVALSLYEEHHRYSRKQKKLE